MSDTTFFNKLFGVDEEPTKEFTDRALRTEPLYTEAVRFLATDFPNPQINVLGQLLWQLVGNKVTPVAMTTVVQSMHFYMEVKGGVKAAAILCPHNWAEMVKENILFQTGAVVFVGSQARDYYNDKYIPGSNMKKRAACFEAEYLLTIKKMNRENNGQPLIWNEWQETMLKTYPEGLAGLERELWYESKQFVPTPPSPIIGSK